MPLNTLFAFWLVSLLFTVSPGMDWAYAIAAGTTRRRVIPAISGMVLGHLICILLVAAGLGTLIKSSPVILPALTACGAAYLLWLGIGQLRTSDTSLHSISTSTGSPLRWLGKGVTISLFNPKVMMIIIAILPQFMAENFSWNPYRQITTLGLIHCLNCFCIYLAVGYAAHLLLTVHPQATKLVNRLSGLAMTVIALLMMGETALRYF